MANDKTCGCHFQRMDCKYPALDALVQQLVDEFAEMLESLHSEQCCGHRGQSCREFTMKYFVPNNDALAAAAKLGYTPTGEDLHG